MKAFFVHALVIFLILLQGYNICLFLHHSSRSVILFFFEHIEIGLIFRTILIGFEASLDIIEIFDMKVDVVIFRCFLVKKM